MAMESHCLGNCRLRVARTVCRAEGSPRCCPIDPAPRRPSSFSPSRHLHGHTFLPAAPGGGTSGSTRIPGMPHIPDGVPGTWSPGRWQVPGSHPGAPQSLGVFAPLEQPAAQVHSGCFECKLDIAARAAANNICTVNRQTVILINR